MCLLSPASAYLRSLHDEALWAWAGKFRVALLLAPPRHINGSPVPIRGGRLRAPVCSQRRYQGHIAAGRRAARRRAAPRRAINDEVRRSSGATPGAVVRVSHCWGTTRPLVATASRATLKINIGRTRLLRRYYIPAIGELHHDEESPQPAPLRSEVERGLCF